MKRTAWMSAALVTAALIAPRAARAGDDTPARLAHLAAGAAWSADGDGAAECLQLYDTAHAHGVDDGVKVTLEQDVGAHTRGSEMTIGELHAVCIARKHVADVRDLTVRFASVVLDAVAQIDHGGSPDIADLKARSKTCADEVDRLLADGAPGELAVVMQGYTGTLGTVKADVCLKGQPAVDRWMEANIAPYLKAGIKNDKLKMILEIYPEPYYLAGGQASTDPRQLAKASVWFFDSPHDGDTCGGGAVTHTLHRYKFDKNQVATETTKPYCGDPPARAYR